MIRFGTIIEFTIMWLNRVKIIIRILRFKKEYNIAFSNQ